MQFTRACAATASCEGRGGWERGGSGGAPATQMKWGLNFVMLDSRRVLVGTPGTCRHWGPAANASQIQMQAVTRAADACGRAQLLAWGFASAPRPSRRRTVCKKMGMVPCGLRFAGLTAPVAHQNACMWWGCVRACLLSTAFTCVMPSHHAFMHVRGSASHLGWRGWSGAPAGSATCA